MPSIDPAGTILITGASGFSGAWVSRACLEAGFYVRGTVRTEAKGRFLQQLFSEFSDRFDTVIIEDISKVYFLGQTTDSCFDLTRWRPLYSRAHSIQRSTGFKE